MRKKVNKKLTKYQVLLKDKRWFLKKHEILDRDNNECTMCYSARNLQVHHKKYMRGRMPWEYDNKDLITLCERCHANLHLKEHLLKAKKELDKMIDLLSESLRG